MCEFFPSASKAGGAGEDYGSSVPPPFPNLRQRNDINIPKKQKNVFTTFPPCASIYLGGSWDFPRFPFVFLTMIRFPALGLKIYGQIGIPDAST